MRLRQRLIPVALALAVVAHAPVHAGDSKVATASFAVSKTRIDTALAGMVSDGRAAGVAKEIPAS